MVFLLVSFLSAVRFRTRIVLFFCKKKWLWGYSSIGLDWLVYEAIFGCNDRFAHLLEPLSTIGDIYDVE